MSNFSDAIILLVACLCVAAIIVFGLAVWTAIGTAILVFLLGWTLTTNTLMAGFVLGLILLIIVDALSGRRVETIVLRR